MPGLEKGRVQSALEAWGQADARSGSPAESGHGSGERSQGPFSAQPYGPVGYGPGASVHGWATDGLRFGVCILGSRSEVSPSNITMAL